MHIPSIMHIDDGEFTSAVTQTQFSYFLGFSMAFKYSSSLVRGPRFEVMAGRRSMSSESLIKKSRSNRSKVDVNRLNIN